MADGSFPSKLTQTLDSSSCDQQIWSICMDSEVCSQRRFGCRVQHFHSHSVVYLPNTTRRHDLKTRQLHHPCAAAARQVTAYDDHPTESALVREDGLWKAPLPGVKECGPKWGATLPCASDAHLPRDCELALVVAAERQMLWAANHH